MAILQVGATSLAQPYITYNKKDATLAQVFKEIKRQTDFTVFYSAKKLNDDRKIDAQFNQTDLKEVLNKCLEGQPLTFTIDEKTIIIKEREKPIPQRIKEFFTDEEASVKPQQQITGSVTDSLGTPLEGASIVVLTADGKRTTVQTTTDRNGMFRLKNVPDGGQVQVSFIGYAAATVVVQANMGTIQLKKSESPLDEVQIIAYGTTSRRLNTGNVTSVRASEIEKQPINNPILALQGRVPGITIAQQTGFAGSGIKVRIQGQNSLAKGSEPLYVIDGVPFGSQMLPSVSSIQGTAGGQSVSPGYGVAGNPLNFINPNDIESIDVLKDADATAIYGSRAANGAILITTKKGGSGETKVDFNLQSGWGTVARKIDLLDTRQYLDMRYEAFENDGIDWRDPAFVANDLKVWDTTRYTDWQKELIGQTANYTNISALISGGTGNVQYLVGSTYHRETTVFPDDFSDQKASVHFNINTASTNQRFKMQFSGNYMLDDNRLPNEDITSHALYLPPVAPPLYTDDGELNWEPNAAGSSTWENPVSYLYRRFNNKTTNLIGNTVLSYEIIPGLNIKSSLGYTNLHSDQIRLSPLTALRPEDRPNGGRNAGYGNSNIRSWIAEPQITYKRTVWKGRLDVLIGSTFQQQNSTGQHLSGWYYNSDDAMLAIRNAGSVFSGPSFALLYRYNALFSRVNYNIADKYIVNITARRDGSSRFGGANQLQNFGAIGAAWIFSEEPIIDENLPIVSFGKLRGSYGITGNDQIGDYEFFNLYTSVFAPVPYQGVSSLATTGLPNPHLQWEQTRKMQLGIDLGLFEDQLLLNATYYDNRSSNQLISYRLPIITGFSNIAQNFPATIQNYGWELSLQSTNIDSRKFKWTSNINITVARNKLLRFPNIENSSYAGWLEIGQPTTINRAFHFMGVNPETGVYQFASSDGQPTSTPSDPSDKTVLFDTSPTLYGGLQNSIGYAGFDLDFLFQFVKQKGRNFRMGYGLPGINRNQPVEVLGRWQRPGDNATYQRFNSNYSIGDQYRLGEASDISYSDASYIRLKNVSLSWSLPEKWRVSDFVRNTKLYAQGQNLLTFTNFVGGDPEYPGSLGLPPLRIFTVGVKATL
ncbi:SusC/RagA family TonB-linked outer membrane protein [Parapedobacter defluvii]|uniref:SusC/RagA family TonB-linked outer membrane protein n=2 Tax=Parapedobacter defluvii TaxID=2045106 RepID=A0ABQ1M4N5_9SPHI|nr:SusC/RagA family TonB-linked outer membrane protein [Parapedobacter defluvii]